MFRPFRQVSNLKRYRQIAAVMARHGFGSLIEYLQLQRRIGIPIRWLRRTPSPQLSPAEHLRLALEELGPTFIKLGQILSTRPDLLPPGFIRELSRLQDAVPPFPWQELAELLQAELGEDPHEVFASIDETPLAAASLAQVHAATLKNGDKVVIKAQRPNILPTIQTDLEILADLAALAQHTPLGKLYNPVEVVEEFSFTLRNELDYRREGRNADRFRSNFEEEPYLYIPRVYWELSTRQVLVLERIHGVKINDLTAMEAAGYDRKKIALNSARIIIKEVLEDGFFHADPHPGNFLVMEDEVIGAMDFGMFGYLSEQLRLDLIRLYSASVAMDPKGIVDQLIRMGAVDTSIDRPRLERDINRLLSKYVGMPLKDIRANEVIEEIMPITFRHRLRLPSDLWLLGKTLGMMEGVGLLLDPDFDVFAVSERFIPRLTWRLLMPDRKLGESLLRHGSAWLEFLNLLPQSGRHLLEKIERDEFFEISIKESNRFLEQQRRNTRQLSLSILVGALILSLGLIIASLSNETAKLWVIGLVLLTTLGMGLWWLLTNLRRR